MMKNYLVTGALLTAISTGFAQDVNKLIDQKDVERVISTLAADDMQGRATFTPGIEKAAQFIESEYKKAGLVPMTGATDYRQNFHLLKSTPVKVQANINGSDIPAEKLLAYGNANFNWTSTAGVEIVKETADKNFRNDYRGFIASGKKMLVVVDPSFAQMLNQMRSRGMSGSTIIKPNPNLAVVFVLGPIADINTLNINYEVKVEEQPALLYNVAGVIPGKSKPDEYVVFSGHYDHLGIRPGMKPDSVFNGADDDASGTTAVIELAKYYKKLNNNARTLIFVAFCAEEIGEYGSQHFATTVNPDKVTAMFNIEMIGKPSKWGQNSGFITGFERSDFGTILQNNLKGTNFTFYPDPYTDQNLFYRSDNASLARVGVPAHTITSDQIDIDQDYHKVTDEVKTLDMANITSIIRAIALSSRSIVSGKDTPTRVPKLER